MKTKKSITWKMFGQILFYSVFFIMITALYTVCRLQVMSILSEEMQQTVSKYLTTVFVLFLVFLALRISRVVVNWYRDTVAAVTATTLDDELIPLIRRVVTLVIWIVAILIVLPVFGVNINALIATLGVSSLAIALAAKDTIANIISGFLLMIDRPFRIGDKIKLPSGEVVEAIDIGVRRSKFLHENNAVIIVPNVDLSKSKIINYSYNPEVKQ